MGCVAKPFHQKSGCVRTESSYLQGESNELSEENRVKRTNVFHAPCPTACQSHSPHLRLSLTLAPTPSVSFTYWRLLLIWLLLVITSSAPTSPMVGSGTLLIPFPLCIEIKPFFFPLNSPLSLDTLKESWYTVPASVANTAGCRVTPHVVKYQLHHSQARQS